jgi:hypothetical protein
MKAFEARMRAEPEVVQAETLAWLNGWFAAYLSWCARFVGGLPHAQVSSLRAVLLVADCAFAWLEIGRGAPACGASAVRCAGSDRLAWRLLG